MNDARDQAVLVPRLNSVDDAYVLVEWLVADGTRVDAGQSVALVETTKTTVDIEAPSAGILVQMVSPRSECRIGQRLAVIHDGPVAPATGMATPVPADMAVPAVAPISSAPAGVGAPESSADPTPSTAVEAVRMSDRARELADALNVTTADMAASGLVVVREHDVRRLAGAPRSTEIPLSRVQRAVRATVEWSHQEIPAAYAGVFVDVDQAIEDARVQSRTHRCLIGLTEMVVWAVARQLGSFPVMFGMLAGDVVRVPEQADVGVTMDLGAGLFVPVVDDAGSADLPGLARHLMRLRRAAAAGSFPAGELGRPGIVIALNGGGSVAVAVPLIYPPNVACVSLGAPRREVDVDEEGMVRAVTRIHLGLAYDHRVINGLEAGHFLEAVKRLMESA